MIAGQTIPADLGSDHRDRIDLWDRLWRAIYKHDEDTPASAPGYTRGWGRVIAGLFQRQPPTSTQETEIDLSGVLAEMTHKGSGYGSVVLRPVFDGLQWKLSVIEPMRFTIQWAERRPVEITVWDTSADPRYPDDDKVGLAIFETWTPDDTSSEAGTISTTVWTTETTAGRRTLAQQVSVDNPPDDLADHPYILSAANDEYRRDMVPFVWSWEDIGPVPVWYTLEQSLEGLARLWDQEQDDAELTRKRIAMPEDSLSKATVRATDGTIIARAGFNKSDNILALSAGMSAQHGPTGGVQPIEFSDDLIQRERIERRENSVLEMAGINPASIGRSVSGTSDSGVAKRADNQATLNTISGPARNAARVLTAATGVIAALNRTPWGDTDEVIVSEGLKENPVESAETARALRDAEAASTRTLVATAHPTWTDEQIDTEVEAMRAENMAASPLEF